MVDIGKEPDNVRFKHVGVLPLKRVRPVDRPMGSLPPSAGVAVKDEPPLEDYWVSAVGRDEATVRR